MRVVAKFAIKNSFKITNRGLCVLGEITEGRVMVGNTITFIDGTRQITLRIASLGMTRSDPPSYDVGLSFIYESEEQRKELESLKLQEQHVEIYSEEE